jgi:hypothetical protein
LRFVVFRRGSPDTHNLYETKLDVAPLEFPGWLADYVEKHSVPEDDSSDKKPAGIQGGDFVNRRDPYGKDQIVLFVFSLGPVLNPRCPSGG